MQKVILPAAFVQLPYAEGLEVAAWRDAPAAVLFELAYLAFKMHRNTVPLTNARLQLVGVSPDAKVRALRRLETVGMVAVDWRGGRKTPTSRYCGYEPARKLPHW